eukprot:380556_1
MLAAILLAMMALPSSTAFTAIHPSNSLARPSPATAIAKTNQPSSPQRRTASSASIIIYQSTWDDFSFDDDDELLDSGIDAEFVAADENDDAEVKAAAGASLEAPEV